MSFFEKVKGIIPPKISKNLIDYEIKLDSSPSKVGDKYSFDIKKKLVTIFLGSLSAKEKRTLKTAIKNSFDEGAVILIEESKKDLLQRLYKYDNKEDNQILTFFQPILSFPDYQVLRDALFLRSEFKNRKSVTTLKGDIRSRYGERGVAISNLCTAGYFEETMIPLYNANQTEFWKYYDIAVERGITALFVNAGMTVDKIGEEINRRLISAKSYGLRKIDIHGIGDNNIKKIKECIELEKTHLGFTVKNIYTDKSLHVCVVEIIF